MIDYILLDKTQFNYILKHINLQTSQLPTLGDINNQYDLYISQE